MHLRVTCQINCQRPYYTLRDECFVYFTYCYCTNQNRIKNPTMNAKNLNRFSAFAFSV